MRLPADQVRTPRVKYCLTTAIVVIAVIVALTGCGLSTENEDSSTMLLDAYVTLGSNWLVVPSSIEPKAGAESAVLTIEEVLWQTTQGANELEVGESIEVNGPSKQTWEEVGEAVAAGNRVILKLSDASEAYSAQFALDVSERVFLEEGGEFETTQLIGFLRDSAPDFLDGSAEDLVVRWNEEVNGPSATLRGPISRAFEAWWERLGSGA